MKKKIISLVIIATSFLSVNAQMTQAETEISFEKTDLEIKNTYHVGIPEGSINDLYKIITEITLNAPPECASSSIGNITVHDCEIDTIPSYTFLKYKNLKEIVLHKCIIKKIEELSLPESVHLTLKECRLNKSSGANISLRNNIDIKNCYFNHDENEDIKN